MEAQENIERFNRQRSVKRQQTAMKVIVEGLVAISFNKVPFNHDATATWFCHIFSDRASAKRIGTTRCGLRSLSRLICYAHHSTRRQTYFNGLQGTTRRIEKPSTMPARVRLLLIPVESVRARPSIPADERRFHFHCRLKFNFAIFCLSLFRESSSLASGDRLATVA